MRKRALKAQWSVGAVLLLTMMTGCSSSSDDLPAEPGAHQNADDKVLAYQRCLVEKGWDAEIDPDGGVSIEHPSQQRSQFQADSDTCKAQAGIPATTPPMTQEEAEQFADAILASADCVVAATGFQPSAPPSRQTLVEQILQNGIPAWSPIGEATTAAGGDDFDKVVEALEPCIPQPPDSYLKRAF